MHSNAFDALTSILGGVGCRLDAIENRAELAMNDLQVMEVLSGLVERVEEILLGIDNGSGSATLANKYRELKSDLKNHSKGYDTDNGQTTASKNQMNFLFPAAQEALLELKIKAGNKPSPEMVDSLVGAQGQLEYYLEQLRTEVDLRTPT